MDEVFGDNFCSQILFRTTGGQSNSLLASSFDILLWYGKSRSLIKYRPPLVEKPQGSGGSGQYVLLEDEYGTEPPFHNDEGTKEGRGTFAFLGTEFWHTTHFIRLGAPL